MLELDTASLNTVVGVTRLLLIILALVAYGRLKRRLASVAVVVHPDDASEKGASEPEKDLLLGAADPEDSANGSAPIVQSTTLIIWGVVILPINVVAWYIPNVAWVAAIDGKVHLWHIILQSLLTVSPATAATQILLFALFLSLKKTRAEPRKVEKYCMLLRIAMLDGVFLAPAGVVFVAYLYPQHMHGFPLVWAAVHASQSLVWAYFFRLSRRESQARVLA